MTRRILAAALTAAAALTITATAADAHGLVAKHVLSAPADPAPRG